MLVSCEPLGSKGRPSGGKKISKEAINELPLARWQGAVQLVSTTDDVEQAVKTLQNCPILGFDTETRPAFKKGQKFKPSLLQLATDETVFLFQLQSTGLPESLRALLETSAIIKAGVAPDFDLLNLQTIAAFTPAGFIDLAQMARLRNIRNQGLRGLAALICGVRISKTARTSNWSKPELTPQQIHYAATDAWISRELYLHLQELPQSPKER
nr:3'-5' exonuclease [uncultured Desulfobulbus sp.]